MTPSLPHILSKSLCLLAVMPGLIVLIMSTTSSAVTADGHASPPPKASKLNPPIISPDVPLSFVTSAATGGVPRVVLTSPRWTIFLEFRDEIITDAEGPHIRKLFRRPTAGGTMEEIWDDSTHGGAGNSSLVPHIWVVYDDGAVLFSRGTELIYVAKPGSSRHWVAKIDKEECYPLYADTSGIVLWPADFTRSHAAYYVAGERDSFDLSNRLNISGAEGIRYVEPLFKRYKNLLVWLDQPSYDVPGSTRYRLALFDLTSRKGWAKDLDIPGNPRLEHFDAVTVQVSGQRYDTATGRKR
jgi:hypothetical protein